jgi:hypothetical protein
MAAEAIPAEKVEVVLASAAFGGAAYYDESPDERDAIVFLNAVTVHTETFEALSSDELNALASRCIDGDEDDPRVMHRRLQFHVDAIDGLVDQLRDAEMRARVGGA